MVFSLYRSDNRACRTQDGIETVYFILRIVCLACGYSIGKREKSKVKNTGQIITVLSLLVTLTYCSSQGDSANQNNHLTVEEIKNRAQKFIPVSTLEAAGFEHIAAFDFDLLFGKGFLYILNMRDRMIAQFEGAELRSVYKAQYGQGPKDMLAPKSMFFYGDKNLAVHDYEKKKIIFFDLNLKYIREVTVSDAFLTFGNSEQGIVAVLSFMSHVFGIVNKNFSIAESFVKVNTELPFQRYRSRWLNEGFFLNTKLAAHTYWLQPKKTCKVDVYDLKNKRHMIRLEWPNRFSPAQKNIDQRKNLLFTVFIAKVGRFFVIQNSIMKTFSPIADFELLVFDDKGALISRGNFPFKLLRLRKVTDDKDMLLYVMDDDEDISYIDLRSII